MTLTTPGLSTAPLTSHLHDVALGKKQEFSRFVQELLVQQEGHAALSLQLDGQKWHDAGVPGLSVRHIERHPDDPDNALLGQRGVDLNCGNTLPHLSVFAAHPSLRGTFITQYHARLSCISGAFLANGVLVTSHDRSLNEYFTPPGVGVELQVLEMSYVMVKYFASTEAVDAAERGPSLAQLGERHARGHDWFTIYPETTT